MTSLCQRLTPIEIVVQFISVIKIGEEEDTFFFFKSKNLSFIVKITFNHGCIKVQKIFNHLR